MYIMTYTRNGVSARMLASGWTPTECARVQAAHEALGYVVTFAYGVWK